MAPASGIRGDKLALYRSASCNDFVRWKCRQTKWLRSRLYTTACHRSVGWLSAVTLLLQATVLVRLQLRVNAAVMVGAYVSCEGDALSREQHMTALTVTLL